ncbi:MAG: DNA polymerase III subunit gamma/tau [Candidatus Margulisiibacteriota bacterium]
MSYISLYRKWRSQTFDDVVGQPAIVQTLKNAIKNNRLAHAYLFTGPRGTGKTSAARILAKALNCEKGPTPSPCGQCDQCTKIRDGHSVNVIEIDAASNRGIDEIRELREKVRYSPVEGRYKVYIIDEVHMLTPEAFNALLKTLEEPPSHTVFVLATTELQKVPLTIASRCQRLDFGRINLPEIENHLQKIAEAEGFTIEEKALNLIGRMAEGGMRDAISLLDQLVSFSGNEITYDDVVMVFGTADEELLFGFGNALADGDIAAALNLIEKGLSEGKSTLQLTRDLVGHFRNILHLIVGSNEALELTKDYLERLKKQAVQFSLPRIKECIRALSRAEMDMKWHPHGRLVLEVALLELSGEGKPVERISVAGASSESVSVVRPAESVNVAAPAIRTTPDVSQDATSTATASLYSRVRSQWQDILEIVKKKLIFAYVSLHEGQPQEINEKGKLVISFRRGYAFHKERLEDKKNKEVVEEALQEVLGEKVLIECTVVEGKKETTLSPKAVADFFEGRVL